MSTATISDPPPDPPPPSRRTLVAQRKRAAARSRWRATKTAAEEALETYIFRLPIELLAETLSLLLPIDLLALSRSCSYFCSILLAPSSAYIWKAARKNFPLTLIPDPTPNWTECSLAAFLFDTHFCKVCNRKVHTPPLTFALRVWLCDKVECRTRFRGNQIVHVAPDGKRDTLGCAYAESHSDLSIGGYHTVLRSSFEAAQARYLNLLANPETEEGTLAELEISRRKLQLLAQWADKLIEWSTATENLRRNTWLKTDSVVGAHAKIRGWIEGNLTHSQTLISLRRQATRRLSALKDDELKQHQAEIEAEFAAAAARHTRRAEDEAREAASKIIKKMFNELQANALSTEAILPTFAQFTQMPALELLKSCSLPLLQKWPAKGKASQPLPSMSALLQDNLKGWVGNAQAQFARHLGFESWVSISTTILHPVERATAWFQCSKCHGFSGRSRIPGALSFKEACCHVCKVGMNRRKRAEADWNPAMFIAVQVARKALACAKLDESICQMSQLKVLGNRFLCKSCPKAALIVMDFPSVIGHCKRHDNMEVEIVANEVAGSIIKHPIEYGLVHETSHLKSAEQDRLRFGCRLCGQHSTRKFMFNGLISHMKALHGIENVRDEDVFPLPGDG